MKTEWMIVPDADIATEIGSSFHKGGKYTNLDLVKFTGRLYQRKLLEYLIAECNKSASIAVAKELLESMIEELEVK